MKRFITLNTNKKVNGIRCGETIVEGETESELGEMGQILQEDGSFIDDTTPIKPIVPQPTNQEILDKQVAIEALAMSIMSGVFDLYMKPKEA